MSKTNKAPKASLELTDRAIADLREIDRYSVSKWGRKTAAKYLAGIEAALDRLRENPGLLRHEPQFAAELYFYRVKMHVLVCSRIENLIVVLTVLHTSMDIPSRLLELLPNFTAEAAYLQNKLREKYTGG